IGIVTNRNRRFTHPAQVSELATEMKSYAKTLPGSVFVVDRRQSSDADEGSERRPGPPRQGDSLNVPCPSCSTIYRVDPAKVPAGGVKARCQVCATVFSVEHALTPQATPPLAAAPAAPSPVTRAPEAF